MVKIMVPSPVNEWDDLGGKFSPYFWLNIQMTCFMVCNHFGGCKVDFFHRQGPDCEGIKEEARSLRAFWDTCCVPTCVPGVNCLYPFGSINDRI